MAAVSCPDDCSAESHDAFRAFAIEHDIVAGRQQTFEAVAESDYLPAKFFAGEHDAAKDGVEPRAIPAAGENANAGLHDEPTIKALPSNRQVIRQPTHDRSPANTTRSGARLRQIDCLSS